jgi:chemotaxis signal transduction protein
MRTRRQESAVAPAHNREAVILFTVGDTRLAIAAAAVEEIRNTEGLRPLSTWSRLRTRIPKLAYVLERSGRSYPVVDACFHFQILPAAATRLLVLRHPAVAVLVQQIDRMAELTAIYAVPRAFTGEERAWYRGLALMADTRGDPQVVPVVNPEAFLTDAEARLLASAAAAKEAGT